MNQEEIDEIHQQSLDETGFWGAEAAGCLVFSRATGRFLIAHRSKDVLQPHHWGTFGGAVDPNEAPIDAVLREISEETGFEGNILDVLPAFVFQSNSFRYSNFIVVIEDEFSPVLNWENQDSRWFDYGNWPLEDEQHFGLTALINDPASDTLMRDLHTSSKDAKRHIL